MKSLLLTLLTLTCWYSLLSAQTITVSTITPTTYCSGEPIRVTFTTTGTFNPGNQFNLQLSAANGDFATTSLLATRTSAGTFTANFPVNQATGSAYRVRVVSTSPSRTTIADPAFSVGATAGDRTVFGINSWNAYVYKQTSGNCANELESNATYTGYYTMDSLSFDTRGRYDQNSAPSLATSTGGSAYQGCAATSTCYMSWIRRQGFPCGYYQIDIPNHDDNVIIKLNGTEIFRYIGCCAGRYNIWRGFLSSSDRIEAYYQNGNGPGFLALSFTKLTNVLYFSNPNPYICATASTGIPLKVRGLTGVTYSWNPAAGLNRTTGDSVVAKPTTTTTYTVSATNAQGCAYTQQITVNVNQPNSINIATNIASATVCNNGEPLTISATGGLRYTWSPSAGLNRTDSSVVIARPAVTTTYTVTGYDACTSQTKQVVVTVQQPVGNPATFGDNKWNVYAFNGNWWKATPQNYLGFYTENNLSFSTRNRWNESSSPSSANTTGGTAWQGCTVLNDNFTFSYKRKGFPCGRYAIDIPFHDDNMAIYVDNILVGEHAGWGDYHTAIWTGYLGANSTVEIVVAEVGGLANLAATFNKLTASDRTPNPWICVGASVGLKVSGLTNYTWTPATGLNRTTGDSVYATPSVTTNYIVTGFSPTTNCTLTDTIKVQVGPPKVVITAVGNSWCGISTQAATLSAVGAATFRWSPATGLNTTTGRIVTALPTQTTRYMCIGSNGCQFDTAYVTVTVTPAPGDPNFYPTNQWNAYVYDINGSNVSNFSKYNGYFTWTTLNFSTLTKYGSGSAPSAANATDGAAYQGCPATAVYGLSIKRTGFTEGIYQIDLTAIDDNIWIYVDDRLLYSRGCCVSTTIPSVLNVYLKPTSRIEVKFNNTGGAGYVGLAFTQTVLSASTNVWAPGSGNTDWNTSSNWSRNSIPTTNEDVTIPSNAAFNPTISINGATCRNLTLGQNITLTFAGAQTLTVSGDLTLNGSVISGASGTIEMKGKSSIGQIRSNSTASVTNIKLNSSNGFQLNCPLIVNNVLTLAVGKVNLFSNTLTITSNSNTSIVRGTGYIRSETNSATNPSILCWNTGTNTGAYVYPFGVDDATYIPVTFNKKTNANTNICLSTRRTFGSDNTPLATGTTLNRNGTNVSNIIVDRWWDITSTVNPLPSPGADITFSYAALENTLPNGTVDLIPQHWNSTYNRWDDVLITQVGTKGVKSGIGSATITGQKEFSPFVVGPINSTLPVTFLYTKVQPTAFGAKLLWATGTEINASHFEVERSADGKSWDKIATQNAAGNSNSRLQYEFADNDLPNSAVIYYRLRQVDFDGKDMYSPVATLNTNGTMPELKVEFFPNPAHDQLFIVAEGVIGEGQIQIMNTLGQVVKEEAIVASGTLTQTVDVSKLQRGTYLLVVQQEGNKVVKRFIKQ